MKKVHHSERTSKHAKRGATLLVTLSFIILLSVAAGGVLDLTLQSYRNSIRNETLQLGKSVAESELENIYYQFMTDVETAVPASEIPTTLSGICDYGTTPTTVREPFLAAHQAQGWTVMRSAYYDSTYGSYTGIVPGTTEMGTVTYVTIWIAVIPPPSNYFAQQNATVYVGRTFVTSNTPIFQFGIFYQGDLEMAPSGTVTMNGAIAANGSIYMGASSGGTLTINKDVTYLAGDYFNANSSGSTVYREPNTPVGSTLSPPIFGTSEASQVSTMATPENLLGGIDVGSEQAARPDLFASDNDVYRSLICPPPGSNTLEYPNANSSLGDDPAIAVQRIYNRAGIIITVNADNTYTAKTGTGTDITAAIAPAITGTTSVYDQREAQNVQVATVNVGALNAIIAANVPNFNGVLYVNMANSSQASPGAVQLTNAATLPYTVGTGGYPNGNGFSVATNGGVYVVGNYNTSTPTLSDGSTNPSMIMGDAVTVLSAGWSNANASLPISQRVASANVSINSGILTGNTAATTTNVSGGVQNLVRFEEDWSGKTVTYNGSLGRLFEAKTFVAPFQQPGTVYLVPSGRNFNFDASLLAHAPAGSPQTTGFSRGTLFTWSPGTNSTP